MKNLRLLCLMLSITTALLITPALAQTTEKYRDTGPDAKRLVIAITGDGYTLSQQTQFRNNAAVLTDYLLTSFPWNTYASTVNVYFVGAVSNESGADQPPMNIYRDTTFDATYWASGIERLLVVNNSKVVTYVSPKVPGYDFIFVLVNDTKYGGSGGSLAVTSLNPSAAEILIHEVGHSYAALADEYISYSGRYGGNEPNAPNVTIQTNRNLIKWRAFIDPTTPIPTIPQSSYPTQTGLFEGAYYYPLGVYRPAYNCKMNALGVPFCKPCAESHARVIHNYAPLADSVSPSTSLAIRLASPQTFTVFGNGYQYLTYYWTLDGKAWGTQTSVSVSPDDVVQPSSRLNLVVTDATPLIANFAPTTLTYSWLLLPPAKVLSSVSQARQQVNTSCVTFPAVVSAVYSGYFYAQDADRTGGIKVNASTTGLAVGQLLTLTGTLDGLQSDLTLGGASWTIDPASPQPPLPILMNSMSLIGKAQGLQQGVADAIGPNNACLLVKLAGKVIPSTTSRFYINDGSKVNILVLAPTGVTVPAANSYVAVTGISSVGKSGTTTYRQLRVRTQADIQVLQ